jgi:hypothetical protein
MAVRRPDWARSLTSVNTGRKLTLLHRLKTDPLPGSPVTASGQWASPLGVLGSMGGPARGSWGIVGGGFGQVGSLAGVRPRSRPLSR